MRTHIDWLTFTMTPRWQQEGSTGYAQALQNAFIDTFGEEMTERAFGFKWEQRERSRAPYVDAWEMSGLGITLFASPTLTHCCIEISGQGCERLIERGLLSGVLVKVHQRVSRLDIASDIQTQTTPEEFTAKTSHERMRASGYQKSESGTTCYVGSQKSDRYARVYRYNDPHPRAHLLRIEHVFRRAYAKVVAKACFEDGLDEIAASAGRAFGWAHQDWQPLVRGDIDLGIVNAERNAGKTIYWMVHSVAPAFRRLVEQGGIVDPEEFIRRYFLSDNKDA